jgi:L-threonylcarbamoyladenylate synthase
MVAVDEAAPGGAAVNEAAGLLRGGGLVAFPTETFYGLGAAALDADAVARVFRVKGRPEDKALLVLVDSPEMAEALAVEIPQGARELMARHWPGPLSLVLRASPTLPHLLTAGTGTVGVRMPGHRVALALVRAAGCPVTAPSANPSGAPPATTAEAVRRYFGSRIDLILDGGATPGGSGSTIADCTDWPPRVLRAGPVSI